MDINDLRALQERFDRKHDWILKSNKLPELIDMLHKDLVGLLGEVGEFANILKKVTITKDNMGLNKCKILFNESKGRLAEELIDTLVYILRIATHLKVDIEKEYLLKLEYNEIKYEKYEI